MLFHSFMAFLLLVAAWVVFYDLIGPRNNFSSCIYSLNTPSDHIRLTKSNRVTEEIQVLFLILILPEVD